MKMERVLVAWLVWAAMVVAELQGLSGCVEKEKMGLVELVKSINLTQLPSDCCSWVGVNCSATTGRVQRLNFIHFPINSRIFGGDSSYYFLNISLLLPFEELLELNLNLFGFDGLINQQDLIKLTRLEMLTMNLNNLTNNVSLQAFANMKNLKYLDLSGNIMSVDLEGICEMKNIIELDLSNNVIRGHLPPCIGNLSQLQLLDIRYNQINGNIPSTIGNLSHLSSLHLQGNHFSGSLSLNFLANSSKLKNLDLCSFNNDFHLETETQSWIPSFQLKKLILRSCNLNKMSNSIIPTFLLHQFDLMRIELDDNNLQEAFPYWLLQNNSKLEFLSISKNSLTGNLILPDNLQVFSPALSYFQISKNRFQGNLPSSFGAMNQLAYLDLSFNSFSGIISKTLLVNNNALSYVDLSNNFLTGNLILPDNLQVFLPALRFFQISKNRFQGNLPSSFGAMNQLAYLDLSFNSFSGILPKTLFANNNALSYVDLSNNLLHGDIYFNLTALSSLRILLLTNNKFNGSIELSSGNLTLLEFLDVSNNLIFGKLSSWIIDFSYLQVLVVSNNSFEGGVPDKLCHISKLAYLDISHNNLSGSIPSCLRILPINFLYMRKCGLSGAIPDGLLINSTLVVLDLSYNDFSPSILPNWVYRQHDLQILLMGGLQLEGEISTHLCELENIAIMDLSHNNFNGTIPSCLFKMPFWATDFDSMPHSLSNFYLNRDSNGLSEVEFTTKGRSITLQGSILNLMNGLDVSSNKLRGQIPPEIGDSETIHSMNLSNNQLWGSIPSSISKLRKIESLDLSSNNLSGQIPPEIVRLNFLSTFNVSNNNLSGLVPTGGQFSNFDEQNYGGNEFLCGPLLRKLCTTSSSPTTTPPDEQGNDDEPILETWSFWWSFIAAYLVAVISAVVVVGIDTRCSRVWFLAVDVLCSKIFCVFAKLKFILGMK